MLFLNARLNINAVSCVKAQWDANDLLRQMKTQKYIYKVVGRCLTLLLCVGLVCSSFSEAFLGGLGGLARAANAAGRAANAAKKAKALEGAAQTAKAVGGIGKAGKLGGLGSASGAAAGVGIAGHIVEQEISKNESQSETANPQTVPGAQATQDSHGVNDDEKDEKETGLREQAESYREEAEQGDAKAQYKLGRCYAKGLGVDKDWVEAVKWYRMAAEQGDAKAQYKLGRCYALGVGVDKYDMVEAAKWYRMAAEQGDANAQYALGRRYYKGTGVSMNIEESERWFIRAEKRLRVQAEQGDEDAQRNLGECYEEGDGVSKDMVEAGKWYRMAAEQGDAHAQLRLGLYLRRGSGSLMAQARAFGRPSRVVNPEAVKWLRAAEEKREDLGVVGSLNLMLNLMDEKSGTEDPPHEDPEEEESPHECPEEGMPWWLYVIFVCILIVKVWIIVSIIVWIIALIKKIIAFHKDVTAKVCRHAAEHGYARAQFNLGVRYENGLGVSKDMGEAVKWYRKAAEQGNAVAQFNLGRCYAHGEGVNEDMTEAVKWFRAAAEQGDENAKVLLEEIESEEIIRQEDSGE